MESMAEAARVRLGRERFLQGGGLRNGLLLRHGRGEIGRRGGYRSTFGRSAEQASQRRETALIEIEVLRRFSSRPVMSLSVSCVSSKVRPRVVW